MPEVININPNDATDSFVVGASIASPTLTPTLPPKFTNGRKRKVDPKLINHYKKNRLKLSRKKSGCLLRGAIIKNRTMMISFILSPNAFQWKGRWPFGAECNNRSAIGISYLQDLLHAFPSINISYRLISRRT